MNTRKIYKIISTLCIAFLITSLFSIKADAAENNTITMDGYIIDADDSTEFIRYASFADVNYSKLSWEIKNIGLINGQLQIVVFDGSEDIVFNGNIYRSYNQEEGNNFVADINNDKYNTLYLNICDVTSNKHYFTDNITSSASFVWYLNDVNGNLIIFEADTTLLNDLSGELNKINETASGNIDTLWFVYTTEPVLSVIEDGIIEESKISTFTSLNSYYTKWRGTTRTNTFYLTGTPIVTTCTPYVEIDAPTSIPSVNSTVYLKTNLAIQQRVTDNGIDVTGRVSEVFSLRDITYKIGASGNAQFSVHQEAHKLQCTGTTAALSALFKYFAPSGVKTALEITELMKTVMTSGTTGTSTTGLSTLSTTVLGNKIKSNYYIAADTELFGDYIGVYATLNPINPNLAANTSGAIRTEWTFIVYDGTNEYSETAVYTSSLTTNIK